MFIQDRHKDYSSKKCARIGEGHSFSERNVEIDYFDALKKVRLTSCSNRELSEDAVRPCFFFSLTFVLKSAGFSKYFCLILQLSWLNIILSQLRSALSALSCSFCKVLWILKAYL